MVPRYESYVYLNPPINTADTGKNVARDKREERGERRKLVERDVSRDTCATIASFRRSGESPSVSDNSARSDGRYGPDGNVSGLVSSPESPGRGASMSPSSLAAASKLVSRVSVRYASQTSRQADGSDYTHIRERDVHSHPRTWLLCGLTTYRARDETETRVTWCIRVRFHDASARYAEVRDHT